MKAYDKISENPDVKYIKDRCKEEEICNAISSNKEFSFINSQNGLLTFVHPVYFLEHLMKANIFEFNPYKNFENYTAIYNSKNGTCEKIDMNTLIQDNPGFAPIFDHYLEKDIEGYAGVNAFYNEDFSNLPAYKTTRYYMYHEGVDFAGEWKKGIQGTPIKALVSCEVVAWGSYGAYGNALFMRRLNGKGFYLLGHLSEYPSDICKKKQYNPGEIVGYVGNTGNCSGCDTQAKRDAGNGAHLHLSYYDYKSNEGDEVEGTGNQISIISDIYLKDLRNPFNHNSEPWKGTKRR